MALNFLCLLVVSSYIILSLWMLARFMTCFYSIWQRGWLSLLRLGSIKLWLLSCQQYFSHWVRWNKLQHWEFPYRVTYVTINCWVATVNSQQETKAISPAACVRDWILSVSTSALEHSCGPLPWKRWAETTTRTQHLLSDDTLKQSKAISTPLTCTNWDKTVLF